MILWLIAGYMWLLIHRPFEIQEWLAPRFVSHFIANCQAAKQAAMNQEWIDGNRISVIFNPLNPTRCNILSDEDQTRQALGIAREEKIVVIVATVRPVKDHETFLRAAKIVLQDFPATRFLVVGDEMGHLALFFLESEGKTIAFQYGYVAKGVFHDCKTGFDSAFKTAAPGHLLYKHILKMCFDNPEIRRRDNLGGLSDGMKMWKFDTCRAGQILVAPRGLSGRLLVYARKNWWPVTTRS